MIEIVIITLLLLILIAIVPQTKNSNEANIRLVENYLPQTQCQECGYSGCRPYAKALVEDNADINRCLPGGETVILKLSQILGKPYQPLYKPPTPKNQMAYIEEQHCIGCFKCVKACPVDAIIGTPKKMHSIINQYCTGCKLCVSPCPVDCIQIVETYG